MFLRRKLKLLSHCAFFSFFFYQDAAGAHVCRGFRGGRGGREGTRVEETQNLMLFCCSMDQSPTEWACGQPTTNSLDQSQNTHWLLEHCSVSESCQLYRPAGVSVSSCVSCLQIDTFSLAGDNILSFWFIFLFKKKLALASVWIISYILFFFLSSVSHLSTVSWCLINCLQI